MAEERCTGVQRRARDELTCLEGFYFPELGGEDGQCRRPKPAWLRDADDDALVGAGAASSAACESGNRLEDNRTCMERRLAAQPL